MRSMKIVVALLMAQTAPAMAADARLSELIAEYEAFVSARHPEVQVQAGKTVSRTETTDPAQLAADAAFARQLTTRLATIDETRLSEDERLSLGVLRSELVTVEALPDLIADQLSGPYVLSYGLDVAQRILDANPLVTAEDARAYVSVLRSVAEELTRGRTRLDAQARRGIRLPKAQVPRSRGTLNQYEAASALWGAPAGERLAKLAPDQREKLLRDAQPAAALVAAAARAFLDALGPDYLAAAPDRIGLSQYPGGEDNYRRNIRRLLTVAVEPRALADLGQRMLAETNRDLAQAAAALNVPGGKAGLRHFAETDPAFRAASAGEVAARYKVCSDRIAPLLAKGFEKLPKAAYRAVPADVPGMTFGQYMPPNPSKPVGEYLFPANGADARSHVNACSLIYHELMPGHHLQVAGALENKAIPEFRRNTFISVYLEGWADYASNYARELGLYDDPRDLLGRLTMNAMTYVRLIVDVGLNHDGWSVEQARAFMRDNTFLTDAEIDSELLRYGADIPGQALTYAYGHLAIRALRDEVAREAGNRFDIRRFHSLVLDSGPLPLDVLRGHVRRGFSLPETAAR